VVGRRPLAVVFAAAAVGGFVALSASPALASTDFKVQPHATATATPAPKGHHGHGQATATNSTAGHSPKHQATPTSSSSGTTTFRSNATPQSTVGSATSQRGGASSEPALPKPTTTPAPQPKASAGAGSINADEASTWQRVDSDHVDRGVVRAFATDLKKAGQSAGFPALLVAVMVGFLLVQHRLDKRDVKLSHADWVSDQGLEFSAPSTIRR